MKHSNTLLQSLQDTKEFADKFAGQLMEGDLILLEGDLGVGKTAFARFLIQALTGEETEVPSPTFTLVQQYEGKKFPIWHFDLYRIHNPDDVFELGWEDVYSGLAIVEWPDRLGQYKNNKNARIWTVSFSMAPNDGRAVTINQIN